MHATEATARSPICLGSRRMPTTRSRQVSHAVSRNSQHEPSSRTHTNHTGSIG